MNMLKYNIFSSIIMSFYSKKLYQDVIQNWRGTGFGYLFLVLLILWIPTMIKFHFMVVDFVDKESPSIIEQIPTVKIDKGQVSIDKPEPYFIKLPKENLTLAIIDTTGQYNSLDNTNAFVLITKNKIIVKRTETESRVFDLSQAENFYFNKETVAYWIEIFKKWIVIFLFPFAVILSFIWRISQILILALVGVIITKIVKTEYNYLTLIRLSCVAITPSLILKTIIQNTGQLFSGWGWLSTFITIGYLFYAITPDKKNGNIIPKIDSAEDKLL